MILKIMLVADRCVQFGRALADVARHTCQKKIVKQLSNAVFAKSHCGIVSVEFA
jgi:hypothetical protein